MDNEIKQVQKELPEEYVYDTYRVVVLRQEKGLIK